MSYEEFSRIHDGPLKKYIDACRALDAALLEQAQYVDSLFEWERLFIKISTTHAQPAGLTDSKILTAPLQQLLCLANEFYMVYAKPTAFRQHMQMVTLCMEMFMWVDVEEPVEYLRKIKSMLDQECESFKLTTRNSPMEEIHDIWMRAWVQVTQELLEYVEKYYSEGFRWLGTVPFPPCILLGYPPLHTRNMNRSLFQELNSKRSCVRLIKHLRDKTSEHLFFSFLTIPVRPFEDIRVEERRNRLTQKKGDFRNIYLRKQNNELYVYKCSNCNIIVEDRMDIINLDSCKRVCILFRSLIYGLQLYDCEHIKIHFYGFTPCIAIYTSHNVTINMTYEGTEVSILTSLSSKVYVMVPHKDQYCRKYRIPTLLKTTIIPDKGIKSVISKTYKQR